MVVSSQQAFNAAEVADAIFSSMLLRREGNPPVHREPETVQSILESIDAGLKMAGLSFAEYLERLRHMRAMSLQQPGQRWRFSARERAVQRVDSAVAQLCALMQPLPSNC